MSEPFEAPVRDIMGPEDSDARSLQDSRTGPKALLSIEIVSDAICPWCWVGKRRLDRALAAVAPDIAATVTWRPFELNPGMPKGGVDRRTYRTRKFGSWERSQALDAQVADAARPDGLVFRHDLMARTPNTVDAHRLIWLAGRHGVQHATVEALFVAYFHDGRDIGDAETLIDIGVSAGLPRADIASMLASDEGIAEVGAELDRAHGLQISGVPTVLIDGRPVFSGAVRSELMEEHLRRAAVGAGA